MVIRATNDAIELERNGGTCPLHNVAEPSGATDAATKQYVDNTLSTTQSVIVGVSPGAIVNSKAVIYTNDGSVNANAVNAGGIVAAGALGDYDAQNPSGASLHTAGGMAIAKSLGVAANALVGGNISCAGHVTASTVTSTSDERLKCERVDLSPQAAKSILLALNPVLYKWTSSGRQDAGFFAQEVQKVCPHLVHTDENGMLSLEYDKIIPYLVAAIKALI